MLTCLVEVIVKVAGFVRLSNVGFSLLGLVRNCAVSEESEFQKDSMRNGERYLLIPHTKLDVKNVVCSKTRAGLQEDRS